MKKHIIIAIISLSIVIVSCNSDEEVSSREDDKEQLDKQFREIQTLASSAKCIDSTDWSFAAYGAKACGGPQGYIPYYLKTDTTLLFAQLNSYEINEKTFNQRWDIISTCNIPPMPAGIRCENENAVLVYN